MGILYVGRYKILFYVLGGIWVGCPTLDNKILAFLTWFFEGDIRECGRHKMILREA